MTDKIPEPFTRRTEMFMIERDTKECIALPIRFRTFLCPHCPLTHIELQCIDMPFTYSLTLPPENADEMANAIMNPLPIDPNLVAAATDK